MKLPAVPDTLGELSSTIASTASETLGAATSALEAAADTVGIDLASLGYGGGGDAHGDAHDDLDVLADLVREHSERIQHNREELARRNIPLDLASISVGPALTKHAMARPEAPVRAPAPKPNPKPNAPARPQFVSVALDGDRTVAIDARDALYRFESGRWIKVPASLTNVAIDGGRICGVNSDEQVFVANDASASRPAWRMMQGRLRQIDLSGDLMGGVDGSGAIFFAPYGTSKWVQKPGVLANISIEQPRACGVDKSDRVWCADSIDEPWELIGGKLRQIVLAGEQMYGVAASGGVFTAPFKSSRWRKIADNAKHVAASAGRVVIVDKAGKVRTLRN